MPFKKGVDPSRDTRGRKRGSKNKNTLIEDALKAYSNKNNLDAKQAIIDTLIKQSIDGDTQSTKLILERLSPSLKPVSCPIRLDVRLPKEPVKRAQKLIDLTIQGELLPDETKILIEGMKSALQIKEFAELEQRIQELERNA